MPKNTDFNHSFDDKHVFVPQFLLKIQAKTSKNNILIFYNFVKKRVSKCFVLVSISIAFKMAPIKQSKLKLQKSIIEFYKLHSKKGHGYTYNQWKRCDFSERTIYRQKEIDHDIIIRMFENLKGRIHLAKESGDGLSSLIKF